MPIMKSRMKALQKQYGKKEGESIYYKMEQEGKNKSKKKSKSKSKGKTKRKKSIFK